MTTQADVLLQLELSIHMAIQRLQEAQRVIDQARQLGALPPAIHEPFLPAPTQNEDGSYTGGRYQEFKCGVCHRVFRGTSAFSTHVRRCP